MNTCKHLKVLIVEDEMIIAMTTSHILEKAGLTVVDITASYDEAIESFRNNEPQLVLLDIMIEGDKDGIEVGKTIKEISPNTVIVYISAYNDFETRSRAEKTFPLAYFNKPFEKAMIENVLTEICVEKI